jgi:hypothetical protein
VGVDPETKPSKPTEPPVRAPISDRCVETPNPEQALAVSMAPPPALGDLGGIMEEIDAFARIGADAPPSIGQPLPGRFEGFDGFVPQREQKNVVEARLHPSGFVIFQPGVANRYPQPTGFRTVAVGYGNDQVRYTAARHNIMGTNQFGQSSTEYPFCLVNMAAWKRTPCDLRAAHWFSAEQEAIDHYRTPVPVPSALEPEACIADFPGGVQVELRHENHSRWQMWEVRGGRKKRRMDFASPYLEHGKATAVLWYGEPQTGWHELK